MGSRARQFSIVFHNVKDDCKPAVERFFSDAQKRIVALEPYPEQHGYHIHVFVQYTNQRYFKSMLAACERFKSHIVSEKPPTETRDWGRVQVDVMRGSFEQAHKYLTAPDKDKPVDPNVRINGTIRDFTLKEFLQHIAEWAQFAARNPHPHHDKYVQRLALLQHRVIQRFGNHFMDDDTYNTYLEDTTVREHISDGNPS